MIDELVEDIVLPVKSWADNQIVHNNWEPAVHKNDLIDTYVFVGASVLKEE